MKRYFKRIVLTVLVILIAAFVMKNFFPAEWSFIVPHKQGDFVRVGNMHNAMSGVPPVLLDDGRVFISSGNTTEIYNPKARRFKEIKKDNFKKNSLPVPVKLKDGRVILIGGSNEHGNTWPDTYIFDPKTNRFEKGPDMIQGRERHSAVLLDDGRVFVAGGVNCGVRNNYLKSTEFYNPKTNRFEKGPDMPEALYGICMTKIENGNIYIYGGVKEYVENQQLNLHNVSVYKLDYIKNRIKQVGYLKRPGYKVKGHKLKSQEVLIYDEYNSVSKNVNIETYNLKTNKSKLLKQSLNIYENINPVFLQNNNILFVGGTSGFGLSYNAHKDAKIYNPYTNEFKLLKTKLNFYRENANTIVLKDGNVLIFGGKIIPIFSLFAKQNPAEIYMFNNKIER